MSSPPKLWDGVVRRLGTELPGFTLEAWVWPLVAEERGDHLRLTCPSQFHRDRLRARFLERIATCAAAEAGRPIQIELSVCEGIAAKVSAGERTQAAPAATPLNAGARSQAAGGNGAARAPARRPSQRAFPYTFDSFVVGPCNALAREAAFAVARGDQETLNLLYLKSDIGLGKTHLARAIVSESRRNGHRRALYTSAESFTNDFMQSIRSKQMDRFKRRYREGCDLLVVEDVPFLTSKGATQLELFHTLTHVLDAGGSVVLTGGCLPRAIPGLDPRLSSQMTAGLVAELDCPDAQVRRRILRSKAAGGGVGLPEDCLDLLVDRVRGNVRDLEGVLIQLVSTASLLKRRIDLSLTESALRKISDPHPQVRELAPRTVMEVVAAFFRTTPEALTSRSRRRDVLVPRQLAMYLCRRFTDEPVGVIARCFGRNHTAVANAEKVIARDILERAPLRYQVEALSERLDQLEQEARSEPSWKSTGRRRGANGGGEGRG
jgi:chromosomal replication initiator protein